MAVRGRLLLSDGNLGTGVRMSYYEACKRTDMGRMRVDAELWARHLVRLQERAREEEEEDVLANPCPSPLVSKPEDTCMHSPQADTESYELERIINLRGHGADMEFYVKYKDYEDLSWQPLGNFLTDDEINVVLLAFMRKYGLFKYADLRERDYLDC